MSPVDRMAPSATTVGNEGYSRMGIISVGPAHDTPGLST
jgi:hypothetical protein